MLNSNIIARKLGFSKAADEMPGADLAPPKKPAQDEGAAEGPDKAEPPLPEMADDAPPMPDPSEPPPVDKIEKLRQILLEAVEEEND